MVDDSNQIFISSHCYNRGAFADDVLLDTTQRKESKVPGISIGSHPFTSLSNRLNRFSVLHLVVPILRVLGFIKGLEVYVRSSFVNFVIFDVKILFVLIDVLNLSLVGYQKAGVVEAAHAGSKIIIDTKVSVEIAICEIHIN